MEPEAVRILKWVYLIVFVVVGAFVLVLTIVTGSSFEFLRFSRLIEGPAAPLILNIFRFLVGFYLLLMLVDAVSLFNYRSVLWREASSIASLLGIILTGLGAIFMIYIMGVAGLISTQTNIIALLYLVIAVGLLLLDLLTFFVEEENLLGLSIKKKKE
ncbi:MAG: hypothetical protein A3F35_00435 [Candidatus Woykebacteria bacterium RIFCSPHIGHO2_12_FULL_45_10]|uniref:DUF2975 domain-containing protein n=1 Tax=Candidatus Woykebacteria bacterium RIFCSPHIGHO2_12_FULL_45_10 TaxID=1802603 RepID=A0A1G1WQ73_9BACT|nr:MAG: hypothetical protein A3F35_00435 [Candidatus Woykebacteria bacterium RIFCSPHIGHO2_12_FULL_45_10]